MPDDRLLHKRAGHSKKITSLTDLEYRVWSQYQLSADDYGVMRYSPLTLQADNDSLAHRPARQVMKALEAVVATGLIVVFTHQDQPYAYQLDWQDFQRVRYPRPTMNPRPPADLLARCSPRTQELFRQHRGAITEDAPQSCGEDAERSPHPAGAGGREWLTATGNGSGNGRPSARMGGGAGAGTFPRDHVNCRPPCVRVCLTEKQHAVLRERHGGTDADLDAFYAAVRASLDPSQPIGDRPWQFWDAQFAAKFGTVAGSVNPRTAGNAAAAARFVARGAK